MKPTMLPVKPDTIPQALRELNQWVVWKSVMEDGKLKKKPIQAYVPESMLVNKSAFVNDLSTWASFKTAFSCLSISSRQLDGIGFVFTAAAGIVGIDLDNKTGPQITSLEDCPAHWRRIVELLDSYTEISPSGTGLHIYIRASLDPALPHKFRDIEVYGDKHYFTVTGHHLAGTSVEVQERQQQLLALYSEFAPARASGRILDYLESRLGVVASPSTPAPLAGSVDVAELFRRGGNDSKLQKLWRGDYSDYPTSQQSGADFALCLKLAHYTDGDLMAMDSLFRQSGLMRDKWDKIHVQGKAYGLATLEKALSKWDKVGWKEPGKPAPLSPNQLPKPDKTSSQAETAATAIPGATVVLPFAEKTAENSSNNTVGGMPAPGVPKNFKLTSTGLYYIPEDSEGGDVKKTWLCSPFKITARTRNSISGAGWGKLIEFTDPDGKLQQWAMPMRELAGSDYVKTLYDLGLEISTYDNCRKLLSRYIQGYTPSETLDCVDRTGWHGGVFVLPDTAIGGRRVILENPLPHNPYSLAGDLACWQKEVAALCAGNTRLGFAVSVALAAPLVSLLAEENGGFHFRGDSSQGKTVALRVAASVWGGSDFLQRWRGTVVGIEQVATQFNDTVLCLDEIGEVEAHTAGDVAYMLANGQGKLRGAKSGGLRKTDRWRLLFLSTGEISLAQHMATGNRQMKAGQEVRLADIPANAGKGYGLFDTVHGYAGGSDFAKHITAAVGQCHGVAGRAFIEKLQAVGIERALLFITRRRKAFLKHIPAQAQGQATRVGYRFGLVAAAGELATALGITGWKRGESTRSAKACFDAWLEARGGAGQRETRQALEQVLAFFEQHGAARFTDWDKPDVLIHNRAGYRRKVGGEDGGVEYFVFPAVFKDEICKALDYRQTAALLVRVGWLMAGSDRPYTRKERFPGMGTAWVCHFNPELEIPDENTLGTLGTWGQNMQLSDNVNKKLSPVCPQSVPSVGTTPPPCDINPLSPVPTMPLGTELGTRNMMIPQGKAPFVPMSPLSPHKKHTPAGKDAEELLEYLLYLDPDRAGKPVEPAELAKAFYWKPARLVAARRFLEEAGQIQTALHPVHAPVKLAINGHAAKAAEELQCLLNSPSTR